MAGLIVEDMVHEGRTGLTEAVVTGPGRAVLFYGHHSLGEGLNLGEARDAAFTLSGIIAWVGKQAQISAKPISLADGRQLIAQAITEGHIKPRGPGHPWSIPPASTPFNFHNQDTSLWLANPPSKCQMMGDALAWASSGTAGARPHATVRPELRSKTMGVMGGPTPVALPLVRPWNWEWQKHSMSTSSSMSSMSERLGGSRHPHHGRHPHREPGGHMKITLPVFKDEDTKDAVTYQSWCWDLTVYCQARCQDHALSSLVPSAHYKVIWGSSWEVSGMDITLDDVLNTLDEHYNNVKALDVLNKKLFQMHMGEKETVSDWGCALIETPADSCGIIPRMHFPLDQVVKLKQWSLLQWNPQMAQSHGGLPKSQCPWEDILWLS